MKNHFHQHGHCCKKGSVVDLIQFCHGKNTCWTLCISVNKGCKAIIFGIITTSFGCPLIRNTINFGISNADAINLMVLLWLKERSETASRMSWQIHCWGRPSLVKISTLDIWIIEVYERLLSDLPNCLSIHMEWFRHGLYCIQHQFQFHITRNNHQKGFAQCPFFVVR